MSIKNLYAFSDFEGSPVLQKIENEFENEFINNQKLNYHNKFKNDVKINDNGIIMDVNNDTVLFFIGDLIDNGELSVAYMQNFLKIKKTKPNNINLIVGNRDLNKVIYYDLMNIVFSLTNENVLYKLLQTTKSSISNEQQLIDICNLLFDETGMLRGEYSFAETIRNKETTQKLIEKTTELLNKNPKEFNVFGICGKVDKNNSELYSSRSVFRLQLIKKLWLGIANHPSTNNPNFYTANINGILKMYFSRKCCAEVFGIGSTESTVEQIINRYKMDTLLTMVMSRNWSNLNYFENKIIHELNGLHFRYLQNTNVILDFSFNNKNYLFSHSFIPTIYENVFVQEQIVNESSNIFIDKLNLSYKNKLRIIYDNDVYNEQKANSIQLIRDISNTGNETTSIVNLNTLFNHDILLGGSYDFFNNVNNLGHYDYFITGHQPAGPVPAINYKGNTIQICVDVSKTDAFTSKYTFGIFHANTIGDERVFGRFIPTFTSAKKENGVIVDLDNIEKNMVHYYDIPKEQFGELIKSGENKEYTIQTYKYVDGNLIPTTYKFYSEKTGQRRNIYYQINNQQMRGSEYYMKKYLKYKHKYLIKNK